MEPERDFGNVLMIKRSVMKKESGGGGRGEHFKLYGKQIIVHDNVLFQVILKDLGYGAPYNTKEQNERMLWEADRIGQNESAKQQDV